MRKELTSILGGLFLLGLTACGHKEPEVPPVMVTQGVVEKVPEVLPPEPRALVHKVGLLLPLSGEHADLGKALQEAAELALFEAGDASVELMPQDTAQGARAAAERALHEGAELLIGPVFAAEVREIKPLLAQHHVNLLCFSTDQSVAGQGVYVLGFLPDQQIERVTRFAGERGLKKIAALTPEGAYGQVVNQTLKRLSAKGEIELLGITPYTRGDILEGNPGNDQILEAVEDYKARGLQALLVPEGGENLYNIARILKSQGGPILLGSGQWDSSETLQVFELMGSFFASPDPQEREHFEDRFRKAYGGVPPRIASLAYDATALAVALAPHGYAAPHLTFAQGFSGADGLFRLTSPGLNERGLAVVEVSPMGFQTLSPAPLSF